MADDPEAVSRFRDWLTNQRHELENLLEVFNCERRVMWQDLKRKRIERDNAEWRDLCAANAEVWETYEEINTYIESGFNYGKTLNLEHPGAAELWRLYQCSGASQSPN